MTEIENIIKGLECCMINPDLCDRTNCPYAGTGDESDYCDAKLIKDAIALLKAQEPRLVTEADFENADGYGFLPVWVEEKDDSEIVCDCITRHAITDPDENYHYRYWTSRPTDEQREATPWN